MADPRIDEAKRAEDAAKRAEDAARQAERERQEASVLAEAAQSAKEAAKRASRFSREFLVTVFAVVTTALGFVVALAWNTALSTWLAQFTAGARIAGLFIYAVGVTFLTVIVIILLSRMARRLGAKPIELKLDTEEEEEKKT
jgi:TRAP-type C4-dicarboxylate transport system permease small subunit